MHIFYVGQPKISDYPAYKQGGPPGDPGFFVRVNSMAADGVATQGS